MSAPLRFLGLALFAWVGVRAASLALLPGVTAVSPASATPIDSSIARSQPVTMDEAQAMAEETVGPYPYPPYPYPYPPSLYAPPPVQPVVIPAGYGSQPRIVYAAYPAPMPPPMAADWRLAPDSFRDDRVAEHVAYSQAPQAGPKAGMAGSTTTPPPPGPTRFDRWQLSAWAMLRNRPGPAGLANGGTLGGSQVGSRLLYRFNHRIAASLRFSSAANGVTGAEAAAGIRYQPLRSLPLAVTLERRQGIGRYGGRSDFAALVEGGLYGRKLAGKARLDAYAQAGVVGIKTRDAFADGALAVSHPLWRNVSAGVGMWGGIQPGLYRLDAGPRVSMDVGRGIRVHADYRQRLVGNAAPPSGPALTISGDF